MRLVFGGKIKAALCLRTNFENNGGGVLPLGALIDGEESVRDVLKKKHPTGKTPQPDTLLTNDNSVHTSVHPVLFERIDGDLIRTAALRTHGGAGPSALDASGWWRLCTSFGTAYDEL